MKKLFTIFLILISGWAFSACVNKSPTESVFTPIKTPTSQTQEKTKAETGTQKQLETQLISLKATMSGQIAFDLLLASSQVEYDEYDFGVFIKSINGLAGNDKNYWALYVNNEYAQTGADNVTLQKGDKIEFKYEEIKTTF